MRVVVVDSDAGRRGLFVARLHQLGHEVRACAELGQADLSDIADVAVLAGAELLVACLQVRRARRARWIIAVPPRERVAEAMVAGANDCMSEAAFGSASIDEQELDLRLEVARAQGGLAPELGPRSGDPLDNAVPRISGAQLRRILDSLPMPVGVVSGAG